MKAVETARENRFEIAHEIPGRIRILSSFLIDPYLDTRYLEAYIEGLPGVETVRLNKMAGCIVVTYDNESDTRTSFLEILENPPREFFCTKYDLSNPPDLTNTFKVGAVLLATFFLPWRLKAILSWITAAPIISKGIKSILAGKITVDILDASAVAFTLLRRDYFAGNAIVLLLTFGEYLEGLTEYRSNRLLLSLYKHEADVVWIEVDGVETEIPVRDVRIGDIVICGHGELISVDGIVAEGAATVNQASITGEPLPVDTTVGDEVFSGTFIEEGRIKIKANRVGAEATTARISKYIEKSLNNKSIIQTESSALADRLVPLTFGMGIAILAVTGDFRRASAVLTVDYSCALKLVSPVAVKTGMNSAAQGGVIIKGAPALEAVARADTFIFDKTGTLTKGSPEVTDVISFNGSTAKEVLSLAAAAEVHYRHPAAAAILEEAARRKITVSQAAECDFIVAHGVSAFVNSFNVLVGNFHFLAEDEGIDCSVSEASAGKLRSQGKSLLYVAREERLIGLIAVRDIVRPEAAATLKRLKAAGVKRLVVLTGDQKESAEALSRELGLDEIHWKLLPEDKGDIIEQLQEQGHVVAFVGDGVNDAPALVKADVGVSMPGSADLAKESAHVVLLNEDLTSLAFSREVSQKVMSVIRKNFYMTLSINSFALLLAVFGFVSPLTAALIHNCSTIGLLGYALKATSIKPRIEQS